LNAQAAKKPAGPTIYGQQVKSLDKELPH